jgi:[ribosomal protein S5]-alanine N-acetyltransferase
MWIRSECGGELDGDSSNRRQELTSKHHRACHRIAPCSEDCLLKPRNMVEITIRELGQREAEELSTMLRNDEVLRRELGFGADDRLSPEDFLKEVVEWCQPRMATMSAILADGTAIGTITLSHRSSDGLSAQVGYWIGSRHRGLGYCTRAFEEALNQAAAEGIGSVLASIASDNIPSRRIWERQGAVAREIAPGKFITNFGLSVNQRVKRVSCPRSALMIQGRSAEEEEKWKTTRTRIVQINQFNRESLTT